MCGISGIYNFSGQTIPNAPELIAQMNDAMRHRGPDDSGVWANGQQQIFLGHQRLSILDTSTAGHQPMTTADGRHTLVYNGEIYNFRELKSHLDNTPFKSNTDTEVLLRLLSQNFESTLPQLRGMFAFAFWDSENETLFLARDRVGQKPLYYTTENGVFAFSSQLKGLLGLPWIKRDLDEEALSHFLTYNHLAPPYTMFKGIKKFEPGHWMAVTREGIKSYKAHYTFPYNKGEEIQSLSEKELADRVYSELEKSVRYRMISDVPVGAFLSGGVDSSAIVGLMSKEIQQPVNTYSIGFEGQPDYDELKNAQRVSKLFGTNHHEKIVSPTNFVDQLPSVLEQFDEPLADTTSIPIYFLSQLARENDTKVVLTGDGADELFAGYSNWKKYIQLAPYFKAYSKLPKAIKKGVRKAYGMRYEASSTYEMLQRSELNQEFFWSGASGFKSGNKNEFLSESFIQRNRDVSSYTIIRQLRADFEALEKDRETTFIDWLCYTGMKQIVPNVFLNRLDKLTMAHSVEGRSPFLDHDLMATAFSISENYKIKSGEAKYILKKSLERLLPDDVLYLEKQGFCVPIKEWAQDIMIDYLTTELNSFCQKVDVFNQRRLEKLIEDVREGNQTNVNRLWTIYFFVQWYNTWFNDAE